MSFTTSYNERNNLATMLSNVPDDQLDNVMADLYRLAEGYLTGTLEPQQQEAAEDPNVISDMLKLMAEEMTEEIIEEEKKHPNDRHRIIIDLD